ncbi:unnamed protein product [Amoebophrya sp. A25]|nr:unnamed protein product [Amoebophrya sp. A25]|eukprot:GSA25T00013096001.1
MAPKHPNKPGPRKGGGKGNKEHFEQRKQEYAETGKKEREARQAAHKKELRREKFEFFRQRAEEKKGGDALLETGVTFVMNNLGHPKPINDLDPHWVCSEVELFGFFPSDFYVEEDAKGVFFEADNNVAQTEGQQGQLLLDADSALLESAPNMNKGLRRVLSELEAFFDEQAYLLELVLYLPFHQFWSNVVYNPTVLPALRSFVAYCTRPHDTGRRQDTGASEAAKASKKPASVSDESGEPKQTMAEARRDLFGETTAELDRARKECYELVFRLLLRLTKRSESPTERMGEQKYAELMQEVWTMPMLLDFCAVYGFVNFDDVHLSVHEVMSVATAQYTTKYAVHRKAFDDLLRKALDRAYDHGDEEAWDFLGDALAQLECVYSFFPDNFSFLSLKNVGGGSSSSASSSSAAPPTEDHGDAQLVVYEDLYQKAAERDDLAFIQKRVRRVIVRFCQARSPLRGGLESFHRLEETMLRFSDVEYPAVDLLSAAWAPVLEEWYGEKSIDVDRVEHLMYLCGIANPRQRRAERQVGPTDAADLFATSVSGEMRGKIGEMEELFGAGSFGHGFLCAVLRHYEQDTARAADAILCDQLPVALAALDKQLSLEAMAASRQQRDHGGPQTSGSSSSGAMLRETPSLLRDAQFGLHKSKKNLSDRDEAKLAQERTLNLVAQQEAEEEEDDGLDDEERTQRFLEMEQAKCDAEYHDFLKHKELTAKKALEYDDEPVIRRGHFLLKEQEKEREFRKRRAEKVKYLEERRRQRDLALAAQKEDAATGGGGSSASGTQKKGADHTQKGANKKGSSEHTGGAGGEDKKGRQNQKWQYDEYYGWNGYYGGSNAQYYKTGNGDYEDAGTTRDENYADGDANGYHDEGEDAVDHKGNSKGGNRQRGFDYAPLNRDQGTLGRKKQWWKNEYDDESCLQESAESSEGTGQTKGKGKETGNSKGKGKQRNGSKGGRSEKQDDAEKEEKKVVQGQSFGARKKEQFKSKAANHNRRDRFAAKMSKAFL